MIRNDTTYRIVVDHLGSVRLVVNSTDGTVVQRVTYDEYGRELGNTNPELQPFGYGGGLSDKDNGLTRFGFRDYDHGTARWTTKDPIGLGGGLNRYEYAGGNPINAVDPYGWQPCRPGAATIRELALSAAVIDAARRMLEASQRDLCERAADIFRGPDGSFRVGEVVIGERGRVRYAPNPDAIGSIHTHPDLIHPSPDGTPGPPGGPPSGEDQTNSLSWGISQVVAERRGAFFVPCENPFIDPILVPWESFGVRQ
jgi:RHS repeat-associated protein